MNDVQRARKDELWLCERNIARFRNKLTNNSDSDECIVLAELLEKEEAKLRQLSRS